MSLRLPYITTPKALRAHAQTQTNLSCAPRCLPLWARHVPHTHTVGSRTRGHSTLDTDEPRSVPVHQPPLNRHSSQVPARSSQTYSTSAALGFRAARSRPCAQTCLGSSPRKSVQAFGRPGLGVHTGSPARQRLTRGLPPPASPSSTGPRPGTPPLPLVTHTHPSHTAETGRRPHIPEGTGRTRLCR